MVSAGGELTMGVAEVLRQLEAALSDQQAARRLLALAAGLDVRSYFVNT